MEAYAEATGNGAGVLVLTNDPSYWQDRRRSDTVDAAFNLRPQVYSAISGSPSLHQREPAHSAS